MTITIVKLPPAPMKERKRTPIDPTTLNWGVDKQTGQAFCTVKRRSPKRDETNEPDYYTIPVDKERCIAHSCTCRDYIKQREPYGDKCTHQTDIEKILREKLIERWREFSREVGGFVL